MLDTGNYEYLITSLLDKENFKTEMFPASKRLVELSATLIQIPTADNTKFINARFKNGIIQTAGAEIVCGDEEYHVLGLQEYWYLINQNL